MGLNYKALRILEKAAERMEFLAPAQTRRVIEYLYQIERPDLKAGSQPPGMEECRVEEFVSRFACRASVNREEVRGYIMNRVTRRLAEKLLEDGFVKILEEETCDGDLKIEARVKVIRITGGDGYVPM